MARVFQWQNVSEQDEAIRHAVARLRDGGLVGFPTETVYGVAASALSAAGVEKLIHCKGRPEDKPLAVCLRDPAEALDWAPGMTTLGRRLSRRCWPGPVTLVFADGLGGGLAERLPDAVRRCVSPNGSLGIRVPLHDAIRETLRRIPGPLVLTSANRSGAPAATDAAQTLAAVGEQLDLLIDDGPTRYGAASSVVKVQGSRWEMLREGVVPADMIERLAQCVVLFVCTGNTCRSPLAEGLCKKLLAERLGCSPAELGQRGFVVLSAGLSAMMGGGATPEAVEIARAHGVDLEGHASQPASAALLSQADYVFTMTRTHWLAIASRFPPLRSRLQLLSPDGTDVADPIGCDQAVYAECAEQIIVALKQHVPTLEA